MIIYKDDFLKQIELHKTNYQVQFNNKIGNKILEIDLQLNEKDFRFEVLYQDERIKPYNMDDSNIYSNISNNLFDINIRGSVHLWDDDIDLIDGDDELNALFCFKTFQSFNKRNKYLEKLFDSLYNFGKKYELIQDIEENNTAKDIENGKIAFNAWFDNMLNNNKSVPKTSYILLTNSDKGMWNQIAKEILEKGVK